MSRDRRAGDPRLADLAERLEVDFADLNSLDAALAHRSWCAENAGNPSNERLEFLGDAVLGLVVTNHLFVSYPDFPEGELAKVRAAVVSSASLAELAEELHLGGHVKLGKGEDLSGGRQKRSILADAVEAVIGAVYLDRDYEVAEQLILRLLGERIALAATGPGGSDFKTRLQELTVRLFDEIPRYEIADHGPDHDKRFRAHVLVAGRPYGEGEGRSKKEAEQAAAQAAYESVKALESQE